MRRLAWGTLVALAALLAGTGASSAAGPERVPAKGLVLGFTGDRIGWVRQSASRYVVRAARPGEKPVTLVSGTLGRGDPVYALGDTRLAVAHVHGNCSRYGCASASLRLETTSIGGATTEAFTCQNGTGLVPSGLSLDGDRLAFGDCAGHIRLRDLRTGADQLVDLFTVPTLLQLAGRYLAGNQGPGNLGVVDTATRKTAFQVPGSYWAYDLGRDGTVALLNSGDFGSCNSAIQIASPAAPSPRTIATGLCQAGVGIAGDRVLVVAPASRGRRVLVSAGRDGSRRSVAGIGFAGDLLAVDSSGSYAAFDRGRCDAGRDVFRVSLANPGPLSLPGKSICPVSLGRRARVRGHHAVLRLRCRRGCSGELVLRARLGGRRRTLGDETFELHARRPLQRVGVTLSRRARRALRRRGRLAVRAKLVAINLRGRHTVIRRRIVLRGRVAQIAQLPRTRRFWACRRRCSEVSRPSGSPGLSSPASSASR